MINIAARLVLYVRTLHNGKVETWKMYSTQWHAFRVIAVINEIKF